MDDRAAPFASVIVVCWNAEATLGRCLRQLGEQDYPAYEVIVVDDASSDGTLAVAEAARASGLELQIVRSERNRGCPGARNLGLRQARGELVGFIDADGFAAPDWLSRAVAHFAEPTVGGVASTVFFDDNPLVLNGAGGTTNRQGWAADLWMNQSFEQAEPGGEALYAMGCGMVFRRETLARVGPFDDRMLNYYDDVDYGMRVWRAGYRRADRARRVDRPRLRSGRRRQRAQAAAVRAPSDARRAQARAVAEEPPALVRAGAARTTPGAIGAAPPEAGCARMERAPSAQHARRAAKPARSAAPARAAPRPLLGRRLPGRGAAALEPGARACACERRDGRAALAGATAARLVSVGARRRTRLPLGGGRRRAPGLAGAAGAAPAPGLRARARRHRRRRARDPPRRPGRVARDALEYAAVLAVHRALDREPPVRAGGGRLRSPVRSRAGLV